MQKSFQVGDEIFYTDQYHGLLYRYNIEANETTIVKDQLDDPFDLAYVDTCKPGGQLIVLLEKSVFYGNLIILNKNGDQIVKKEGTNARDLTVGSNNTLWVNGDMSV